MKLVGRRGSAQPTVHKFTAPARHGVTRLLPSQRAIGRDKPRPVFASRAPDADAIIPVEELGKAAPLFDAVGCRARVDPFMLHGPPQALDEDVVVAAPASIYADLDPVIAQDLGELVAGELRSLIGIEDAGLAEPAEGLAQRLDAELRP